MQVDHPPAETMQVGHALIMLAELPDWNPDQRPSSRSPPPPGSFPPASRLQLSVRHSSASLAIASASRSPLEPLPACSVARFSSSSTRGLAVFRSGATRVSATADRA